MELLVYKASAGSGKTFTLAVEYIKHLLLHPRAYQQILAVTFTNKATAEMKERILQQLYGIWQADKGSEAYLARIREDFAGKNDPTLIMTDQELRQRAGTALQYMLHDYSRFRVETIDSFFQSVMRNLARELELSPNLNIELNNTEVLSDAVDSLIEKLTPTSPVLAWLLEYIEERIASDKRWNVSNEIKGFGRNIFDEHYIERGEDLRLCLQTPDTVRLYRDVLRELETEALDQMKSFYDQFEGELEGHALDVEDLSYKSKGINSYFSKLRDGKLSDKDVLNATLQKHLADAKNWATKTSDRKDDIIRLAQSSLMPLLQEAEAMRPQRSYTVNSCRLSLQHLNKLQLLNHIDQEVRVLNEANNRFLLSDTNALLHRLMGDGDSSFVFEKIGANIRNVMIDEFQDTSRMQWDNFRLLLLEGLAQGADSLIVGDVKQSIYRWRGGDWGILNEELKMGSEKLNPMFASSLSVRSLKTNRRSESRIIGFNNHLFKATVEQLNTIHLEELGQECEPLKQAYADVEQLSPKSEERGYVQVSLLQPEEEDNYVEQTLHGMGHEVQRLLHAGVRLNDITILVRKNKNTPPIAQYFDKELHLPIVSDEAFRLDASLAIGMLMDALRFLSNPNDHIARASLVANYRLQIASEEESDWNRLMQASAQEMLPPTFMERCAQLRLMPLYELLEELFSLFGMSRIEKQDAYLCCFFDAVTEYLQNNSSSLDGFLHHWDEKLCAKTIPSGQMDGIRILSIHKSKGLEFHTVLLPFCDWKMENETNNQLVWCTATEAPYNALSLIPVNYSTTMAQSVYRPDYLHERLQLWVDNLNLLYVALTRAGSNLLLWGKAEQRGTMSQLLAQALPTIAAAGVGQWDEEAALYQHGTPLPSPCVSQESVSVSTNKLAVKPQKLPVRMESMRHEVEFRQSNRSADFIAGRDEAQSSQRFLNRGRLLHTLFSAIRTEADIENAISQLVFEGLIGSQETEQEIRELTQQAFSAAQIKDWYSGEWQLFNECDIIWLENGQLCNRRPDRVMKKGEQVVVVDFKFGKPDLRYNKQVRGYMQLLTRMGYRKEDIRGYLWYVRPQPLSEGEGSSGRTEGVEEVFWEKSSTEKKGKKGEKEGEEKPSATKRKGYETAEGAIYGCLKNNKQEDKKKETEGITQHRNKLK